MRLTWLAIVGLCSLSQVIILRYMAVNESNHWHKACHSPVRIGSAVPISTIANRATSGWRLYHHQQQQNSGIRERCRTMKMKLRPSTFHLWWSWLWHKRNAQRRILHRDNNSNIVSFDFQVTIAGKNLEHAQNARSDPLSSTCTFSAHLDWVISGS